MGVFSSNPFSKLALPGRAPVVWLTAIVVFGIQAVVEFSGGPDGVPGIYETFGLHGEAVLLRWRIWQLFTYGWLHGGMIHVGLNVLCLILVGSRIEVMLGKAVFLRVLMLGILLGGLGHVAFAAKGAEAPILVGLSGGCVGLLLLLTTLSPQSKMWPLPISGRSLGLGIIFTELLLAMCDPALGIPGFSSIGGWLVARGLGSWFIVGHACHFGGACAGWAYGRWILRPRISIASLRRERERREARINVDFKKAD